MDSALSQWASHPELPRRLAMQLLAAAQQAPEQGVELVVIGDQAPQRAVMSRGSESKQSIWADFSYRPGSPSAPAAEQFAADPDRLRLTASLATKGVLQLRAWLLKAGRVVEIDLRLVD